MFGSKTLLGHLVRGIIGGGALYAVVTYYPLYGWPLLLLMPIVLFALKGCPLCWLTGLIETMVKRDKKHMCVDGSCTLKTPNRS
jgi:hypothetical protein